MNQDRQLVNMLTHWATCYGRTPEIDLFVRWVYQQYGMVEKTDIANDPNTSPQSDLFQ